MITSSAISPKATILKFEIGSDDDTLTCQALAKLPTSTAPQIDEPLFPFIDEYYQAAYNLGYRSFCTESEIVYLIK